MVLWSTFGFFGGSTSTYSCNKKNGESSLKHKIVRIIQNTKDYIVILLSNTHPIAIKGHIMVGGHYLLLNVRHIYNKQTGKKNAAVMQPEKIMSCLCFSTNVV